VTKNVGPGTCPLNSARLHKAGLSHGHLLSSAADLPPIGRKSLLFVLHDTTEFSFQRESPDRIGVTYNVNSGIKKLWVIERLIGCVLRKRRYGKSWMLREKLRLTESKAI